tara:strand:- start:2259 stop:3152 length:894 start_codon:yes stop_codon:yes gene_type:complete
MKQSRWFACLISAFVAVFGVSTASAETDAIADLACPYVPALGEAQKTPITPRGLIDCLDDPDPAVRDEFAYSRFAQLLRSGENSDDELRILLERLTALVEHADADPNGFRGPFAMLALSEIARTDRIEAWMTPEERKHLINTAAWYLASLTDYRGFVDGEGWRHGVAHTADVLMQLSLSDRVDEIEAEMIVQIIGPSVAPPNAPAYTFGEPGRLARPILFLARAGLMDGDRGMNVFNGLKPNDHPRWQNPYMNEAGLRALHNTRAFAYAVYTNASASETETDDILADLALDLLASLP